MTDNDIIKALEHCFESCNGTCPYYKYKDCRHRLYLNALDLIDRQKAEIEKLKKGINIELDNFASEYDNKIKAEAVKAFAERLKKRMGFCDLPNGIVRSHIDNLLKEMVGDE